jgi:hypothetical protein
MSDIVHLIASVGPHIDWHRLLQKTAEHWPLLLAQIFVFLYVYPELSDSVPRWLLDELLERAHAESGRERSGERVTRGTLISRFSFTIDVHEWGFRDIRAEEIQQVEELPIVREIAGSDVWDESSRAVTEYRARVA